MDPGFWVERWELGQTAWDQPAPHPTLVERWASLGARSGSTVFVPLCGASIDMVWLAGQGHRVVGVDVSDLAVRRFFDLVGSTPTTQSVGAHTVCTSGPYEFWCGDLFELPAEAVADVGAVYDRASLVALPPDLRRRYAEQVATLLPAADVFLLTFVYDQTEMPGPPFSVEPAEVDALFGEHFESDHVADDDLLVRNPEFGVRGLSWIREHLHVLRPR